MVSARKAKEQTQGLNQSQYTLGSRGPSLRRAMLDHKSDTRPCTKLPQEESSDSTRLSSKRQRDKRPQLSDAMRARLNPQEPRKTRPPVATTWGAHPDPLVTPMVQNVFSHQAIRQAGRNPLNEPPTGSISKRLDDMLSTPFCFHIIHYEPLRGFLVPNFPHTMEPMIPSITSCTIVNS